MKFTREVPGNVHLIRSYAPGELCIGEQRLYGSCLVSASELIVDWPPRRLAEVTLEQLAPLLAWRPEIFVLGTGPRQKFPAQSLYASILAKHIGVEIMDTGAACRTFNVLVGENRRVAAALLLDD